MSKHSMRARRFGQVERVLQRLLDGLRVRLQHAEARVEAVLGVGLHQVEQRALLLAALRRADLDPAVRASRRAALPAPRDLRTPPGTWISRGHVLLVEIDLLEQRRRKTRRARMRTVPRWSSQKNSRRSTIWPLRRWKRLTRDQRRLGVDSRRYRRRRPWRRPSSAALRSLPRW